VNGPTELRRCHHLRASLSLLDLESSRHWPPAESVARPRGRSTKRAAPEGTARPAGIPNASRNCRPGTSRDPGSLRGVAPASPPGPDVATGPVDAPRTRCWFACDPLPDPSPKRRTERRTARGGMRSWHHRNCGTRGDRSPPSRHTLPGRCCHLPSRPAASDVRRPTSHRPRSLMLDPGFDPESAHPLQAPPHARMPKHPRSRSSSALFHKPRRRVSRSPPVSPPWEPPPAHEEPACATVAGAPKDTTTTARGLRPHRCGRGDLLGSGDKSPSPKARSRRAGEACFTIRGTKAPRGAIAAASFRPAKR